MQIPQKSGVLAAMTLAVLGAALPLGAGAATTAAAATVPAPVSAKAKAAADAKAVNDTWLQWTTTQMQPMFYGGGG